MVFCFDQVKSWCIFNFFPLPNNSFYCNLRQSVDRQKNKVNIIKKMGTNNQEKVIYHYEIEHFPQLG